MESSQFSNSQTRFDTIEQMDTQGATCDTFRVKLYGKLHFLKRLKPEFAGDIRYQEAIRKEFETGYQLEHPNLVRYISFDENCILMEYVDGETLAQRLAKNPDYFSDQKHTDKFVLQLLSALQYLHSHQVLHLDLKPDNILLTRINSDVKLVDLGFCRTDAFVDTQGYTSGFAAPEQLSGGAVDVRSDIYAFGKILELLPNRCIFNKVITRCTADNPLDRYQSVAEIRYDIVNAKRNFFHHVALVVAIAVVLAVALTILTHQSDVVPLPEDSIRDTVSTTQQAIPPLRKDTTLQTAPESAPSPESEAVRKDEKMLMMEEMSRMIDKAYRSTISSFCDSVWPPLVNYPGNPWADSSTEFHNQVVEIGDRLVKKYPNIPESVIRQDCEIRFQSLVTSVFNQMRTNAQQ